MEYAAGYSEGTEPPRIAGVPLSHVSIEVGHLRMEDLDSGDDWIREQFRKVVPLVTWFTDAAKAEFGPQARVSTCLLVDDYFRADTDPRDVLGRLLGCAEDKGLTIDYLGREAGCAVVPATGETPGIELAQSVRARIVAAPARGATGRRPPTDQSGWLCNGTRAADEPTQAMRNEPYQPPEEFGTPAHSIFLDVELWRAEPRKQQGSTELPITWSLPFLTSIWQLLRLGLLRFHGRPVVEPQLWDRRQPWPASWSELPAVLKLNPRAKPFAAYRSLSVLPVRYLEVEHAVRLILEHIRLDDEVVEQLVRRAAQERVTLPPSSTERLNYHLVDGH
ncbi:SCO2522 family protein [Nocardia suismassiliense]|uniref:SCO2522 family protein n=1 Tax=Nocardia suismassiliense TaxID=2077092 RepID=UPI000D1D5E4D|nr:SCO2522 family protein [Nocardia suismassiliense]